MNFVIEGLAEVAECFVDLWINKLCSRCGFVLVKPDMSYSEEIMAYRQELLDYDSSMDGCATLRRCETVEEWFGEIAKYNCRGTLPEGYVLADQFIFVRRKDRRIVGMIQFRHELNEICERFFGNIGYSVRPTERRKGYATKMLKRCLRIAKKEGLTRVLITCADTNEASRKTILKCGGVYENTVYYEEDKENLERYWISFGY